MLVAMDDAIGDNRTADQSGRRPRLRPVEVHPHPDEPGSMVLVHDPSGLAEGVLSMSLPALQILSLFDGERTLDEIHSAFTERHGEVLERDTLRDMIGHLESAYFLEGAVFEEHYGTLLEDYRSAPTRRMNEPNGFGLDGDDVPTALTRLLPWETNGSSAARIVGLIAPHLDYPRGRPCYIKAYSALSTQKHIRRYVILGTNHFGRSASVVATGNDFETPLGTSKVDVAFLEELERRCGESLRHYELDHLREHSIELQVLLLQQLFGSDAFQIVPFACPSPCGPSGTAPYDGVGVDLRDFALALGELVAEDDTPTCIIAGADLSHVGKFFGDTDELSDEFLQRARDRDRKVLNHIEGNRPDELVAQVAGDDNPTRVCSAGCIYALMTALPDASVRLLDYHQAVNLEASCAVTCAAAVFEAP